MERLDESIVWDQYATYVATDGSFLARSQTQLFRSFLARESARLLESSRRRLSGLRVPCLTPAKNPFN